MNPEERMDFIFKAASTLNTMQIIFFILAGVFAWVIPYYIFEKAAKEAERQGKQDVRKVSYDSLFPYPKISLTSKLAIIGSCICAFIMGIAAIVVG